MARSTATLTDAFQQIATGRCVITVIRSGRYTFNDVNSATAATTSFFKAGEQLVQNEIKPTYARSDGGVVLVDQEG